MSTNNDDVKRASNFISGYLSPTTRSAYAAKAQPPDKGGKTDEAGKDDDRKQQLHEALERHHRATFHPSNTTLEKAEKTSRILVDAAKPEDKATPKAK